MNIFEKPPAIIQAYQEEKRKGNIPIDKGQFTLETPEREALFEANRGSDDPAGYQEYRRRWSEYPLTQYVANYPLHVDIELASICNLKCPMCYTITPEFKEKVNTKLMKFELFQKIIDEIADKGVYSIRLSLRGESFLHKRIVDCIKYAKQKGIKEVSTLTNGVKLDEKLFAEIMDAGIDWITISVDGIGKTYESIRSPAKFDRLVEKLTNFKRIKQEAGRVKPVIKIQGILPSLRANLTEYYEIFSPIVDMVSSNPLIDYLQKDDASKLEYIKDFTCPQHYQRLVVGADGIVMMCSNDEENESPVGDANKQTIQEIWHGELLQAARDAQKAHKGVKCYGICRKCYIPRQTYREELKIGSRTVYAENYTNRSQEVGT